MVQKLDLNSLTATVRVNGHDVELPFSDLFPPQDRRGGSKRRDGRSPRRGKKPEAKGDRPMRPKAPSKKSAQATRKWLLEAAEGTEVFVAPFKRRARLVRVDTEKDQATVLSGSFELEVPLSDLQRPRQRPDRKTDDTPKDADAPQSGA